MEFLNGILVEVCGHTLESESGILPSFFRSTKTLSMKRLEFFCFVDFFVRIFEAREESGFL